MGIMQNIQLFTRAMQVKKLIKEDNTMKKILLSLILILSLAILCSCNSQNNVIVDDETTVETSNNVTAESTQVETQIDASQIENTETETTKEETSHDHTSGVCDCYPNMETLKDTTSDSQANEIIEDISSEIVEETTENKNPIVRENVVYVSYMPSDFVGTNARVSIVPEKFSLVSYVDSEKTEILQPIDEFIFYGENYELKYQFTKKYTLSRESSSEVRSVSFYSSGDSVYLSIVDGTNKLTSLSILDKRTSDPNAKIISKDEAENIALGFMKEFSLATSLEGFDVVYYEGEMLRFFYKMHIGKYEISGEKYVVGMNTAGEIVLYSDDTTGLYDKFIGKVTEADIAEAEKNLYPYRLPGAYGYYEPYLKIGNDGNLYLCSSYLVDEIIDGEEITREYMFYSRVYYEE